MHRRTFCFAAVVIAVSSGCAVAQGGAHDPTAFEDPLVAAVSGLVGNEPGAHFLVDPNPQRIDLERFSMPRRSGYHTQLEGAAARAEALGSLGVETGAGVPVREACDGYLIPPPRVTRGCPSEPVTVVLVDTLRRGPQAGEGVVPVMTIHYGPGGRGINLFAVHVRRADVGWRFLRSEFVMAID